MRLWITGVGMVTGLGAGAGVCMDRLCRGERAFHPVRVFDGSDHRVDLVSEVHDASALSPGFVLPRTESMAIAAAREALAQAAVQPARQQVDLVFGTTTAGTLEIEQTLAALFDMRPSAPLPPELTDTIALSAERIASVVGPFSQVRTVSSACSTGAMAILIAACWLRAGVSTCVLAGAADGLCRLTLTGFNALGSLDPLPCRPFDRSRNGLSLGEGAAFVVLERDDAAAARGARPIAELAGWAAGAEAHHITNPEPSGRTPARLMLDAIAMAGLSPREIDYVNAHGTATVLNDTMEIQSLRSVFGDDLDRVRVSSIKGQIGHTLGAAGSIEAVVSALAVHQQRIPPTAGLESPGEDCRAGHVLHRAVDAPVRAALSSSFGFGGLDAVLLLASPGRAAPLPEPAAPRVVLLSGAVLGPLGLHDSLQSRAYLQQGDPPAIGPVPFDDAACLDRARARRLGRAERMLATVIGRALSGTGSRALADPQRVGLVASRLSGNPGPTARFLARARDRGPRFAPPADFPNLMLSSIAGHATIYHRLHGPAVATTDRGASGAAAFLTAVDLLSSGCADVMIAGSADDWDICGQSRPTCSLPGVDHDVPSTEGAAVLVLCRDDHPCAAERQAAALLFAQTWATTDARVAVLSRIPPPAGLPIVVACGTVDPQWVPASWAHAPIAHVESRAGMHDAVGATAIVAAFGQVASGDATTALVIVGGAIAGYVFVIGAR